MLLPAAAEPAAAAPAAPQPAAPADPAASARHLPVEFRGSAREYFGIWIVNLVLTILTLGIWSAWAKVRRKRFFLGSTRIDGDAFDYHATGGQILKGRILAVAVFVGLNVASDFFPYVGMGLSVALLFVLPWVINQSLRFNARMTSWRNVRFDFQASYWKALLGFILLPLLGVLSLGLLWPLATRYSSRYVARSHRFGTARLDAAPRIAPYYGAGALAALIALAITTAIAVVMVAVAGVQRADLFDPWKVQRIVWFAMLAVLAGFYVAGIFYGARVRNVIVGDMTLEAGHRFRSTLSGARLAWIVLSNFVCVVASLGLLRPWAAVRQYRYEAACLSMLAAGGLDGFVGAGGRAGGAFGSEFAAFEGIDIGL